MSDGAPGDTILRYVGASPRRDGCWRGERWRGERCESPFTLLRGVDVPGERGKHRDAGASRESPFSPALAGR